MTAGSATRSAPCARGAKMPSISLKHWAAVCTFAHPECMALATVASGVDAFPRRRWRCQSADRGGGAVISAATTGQSARCAATRDTSQHWGIAKMRAWLATQLATGGMGGGALAKTQRAWPDVSIATLARSPKHPSASSAGTATRSVPPRRGTDRLSSSS